MSDTLKVSIGQHSDKGCKEVNQDFHGACMPQGLALAAKGVVVALADGISSSDVSHIASAAAVHGLLQDYYCTSDAWSVKRSAQCVLAATNSWLHAQTQRSPYRFDKDRGYVCTLSALIVKSATAHLFHVGDTRIYRVQGKALEQLTEDHRVRLSAEQIYLGRALGVQPQLEVDYRALPVEPADIFVLTTDGVHEHVSASFITQAIEAHATDLDQAARAIVDEAYAGDIIGLFDPGIFSIGDTLCTGKQHVQFAGIPTFAPEHFARVTQVDTMKRKQFVKGMEQIAQEGAIQIFQEFNTGMEEIIVGVVGVLQFDVLKYRLENEYNVEIRLEPLPYEHIRWIENEEINMDKLVGTSDMKKIKDMKGNPLLLFVNSWSVGMVLDRNKGLELSEFGKN